MIHLIIIDIYVAICNLSRCASITWFTCITVIVISRWIIHCKNLFFWIINQYHWQSCKSKQRSKKASTFEPFNLLIIHLQPFRFDTVWNRIDKHIWFTRLIDIVMYCFWTTKTNHHLLAPCKQHRIIAAILGMITTGCSTYQMLYGFVRWMWLQISLWHIATDCFECIIRECFTEYAKLVQISIHNANKSQQHTHLCHSLCLMILQINLKML